MDQTSNQHNWDGNLSSKPRPSCTPPPIGKDDEVFLSFRGEDTRKEFTDHLYLKLKDAGVEVFRDNEKLHIGEKIGPQLMKAIKASKISIPIISPNYASSEWCLRELVQILKCKTTGQIVIPIFYKVTPSSVRNQTSQFGQAFLSHQKKYDSNDVQRWRKALEEVASMKGLESNKIADGHEGELTKIVLKKVLKKLKKVNLAVEDRLIGVQDHIDMIIKEVNPEASDEVQVLLIHGMGGIGKTTLAKLIYNHFSTQYDHRSFLWDVRERSSESRGTVDLQKQLISNIFEKELAENITYIDEGIRIIKEKLREKRVLILLDDVNHRDQLNALARESNWFKPGSLLIVTSRSGDILENWDRKLTYELNELDPEKSFRLFCLLAFGREGAPHSLLEEIAREIVCITKGLPLAIRVIGSLLFGKSIDGWKTTLQELKTEPNNDVMRILKISYDSLKEEEKQIFLDIACFSFIAGMKKEILYYMCNVCKFQTCQHVENLISLSLKKIGEGGRVVMHDHLRDLGKTMVRGESINYPENRSRLWAQEDAWEVLNGKRGTKKIEAISLVSDDEKFKAYHLTSEHFKRMKRLRLLFLEGASLDGDFNNLLTNLRWLHWSKCPSGSMPTNFHPQKLMILELYDVPITEHWSSWSQAELVEKLKVVRLEKCRELTTTPDFSEFKKLEILILRDCPRLTEIHPSIQSVHETLITLDVSGCWNLKKLPEKVGEMKRLKKLHVNSTNIKKIPMSEGSMSDLEILTAEGCKQIYKLPNSMGSLVNLHTLSLSGCTLLSEIPASIGKLGALSELDLSKTNIKKLPESIGNLGSLFKLNLSGTEIKELPESIGNLYNLEELNINFSGIERLTPAIGKLRKLRQLRANLVFKIREIPEEIGELTRLQHLSLCGSHVSWLPASIHNLSNLQELRLLACRELASLPDLPCSLKTLDFDGDSMETLPSLSNLTNLKSLSYRDSYHKQIRVLNLGNLTKLEDLVIFSQVHCEESGEISSLHLELPSSLVKLEIIGFRTLPPHPNLSSLKRFRCLRLRQYPELRNINVLDGAKNLQSLEMTRCSHLQEIQLPNNMESLEHLEIHECSYLQRIGGLSCSMKFKVLTLSDCKMLSGVEGIGQLTSLERLNLSELPCLETIGDLYHLKKLKDFHLSDCKMLRSVEGIDQLTSLERLNLNELPCLESIGNLSHLKKLKDFHLSDCKMLRGVEGIDQLTSLERLNLNELPCLKSIGNLSHLKKLREVNLSNCETLRDVERIGQVTYLEKLNLKKLPCLETTGDLSHLKKLEELNLSDCKMLKGVEGLGQLTSLKELKLHMLPCLKTIGDLSHLKKLREVYLSDCKKLREVERMGQLISLEKLNLIKLPCLETIGGLSHLKKLEDLNLSDCKMLRCVEGIGQLKSLKELKLHMLPCLKTIGDLSHLKKLKKVYLSDCKMLRGVEGIDQQTSMIILHIINCPCLSKYKAWSH